MSTFIKDDGTVSPTFGRNEYARSTNSKPLNESYTCAASTVYTDANGRKILQPGTVMAKITSGGEAGKVGPFDLAATDGRQTLTNIVGLNDTFLPWQLLERDVEIACNYDMVAVQAWCIEFNGSATPVVCRDATAAAMHNQKKLNIRWA